MLQEMPRETALSWFCQLKRTESWGRVSPHAMLRMTDGGQHNGGHWRAATPGGRDRGPAALSKWPLLPGLWGPTAVINGGPTGQMDPVANRVKQETCVLGRTAAPQSTWGTPTC